MLWRLGLIKGCSPMKCPPTELRANCKASRISASPVSAAGVLCTKAAKAPSWHLCPRALESHSREQDTGDTAGILGKRGSDSHWKPGANNHRQMGVRLPVKINKNWGMGFVVLKGALCSTGTDLWKVCPLQGKLSYMTCRFIRFFFHSGKSLSLLVTWYFGYTPVPGWNSSLKSRGIHMRTGPPKRILFQVFLGLMSKKIIQLLEFHKISFY